MPAATPSSQTNEAPGTLSTSSTNSQDTSQEVEEDGFQTVSRRRNKGKSSVALQNLNTIPKVINTRQAYKASLTKIAPTRNISNDELVKSKDKEMGSGEVPHIPPTPNL